MATKTTQQQSSRSSGDTQPVILRVNSREGQKLRAADLADEQLYRVAMRRVHNIGPHDWGIVFGLALQIADADLIIQPGMAVEGYGRELIVSEPAVIPIETIATDNHYDVVTNLMVWLAYQPQSAAPSTSAANCHFSNRSQETACFFLTLVDETPSLKPEQDKAEQIIPASETVPDPYSVPQLDLNFRAEDITGGDQPERLWPVYLGTITLDANGWYVKSTVRRYAEISGESVTAPSGRVRMQVGTEQ